MSSESVLSLINTTSGYNQKTSISYKNVLSGPEWTINI